MGGQCYRLPPSGPKQPLWVTPVGHTDVTVLPMGCEVRGLGSPTSTLDRFKRLDRLSWEWTPFLPEEDAVRGGTAGGQTLWRWREGGDEPCA